MRSGFTAASCWTGRLTDGTTVFVKVATDDETRRANRIEATVLESVSSPHLPALVAATTDGRVLVSEDLTHADWQPELGDLDGFWAAVTHIGALGAPAGVAVSPPGQGRDPWSAMGRDGRLARAIGLEPGWLDAHGAELASTAATADTSGIALVHGDLAPGNWCRTAAGRWVFVDWAAARRATALVDDAIASIRLTRLGTGDVRLSPRLADRPEIAVLIAGFFAAELLEVDWSAWPPSARADRVADVVAGLAVSAELLGLPPLTRCR